MWSICVSEWQCIYSYGSSMNKTNIANLNIPADQLERIGRWLNANPRKALFVILLLLMLKSGFAIEYINISQSYLPGALAFPIPSGYYSSGIGNIILFNMFGMDSTIEWISLHVFLITIALLFLSFLCLRSRYSVVLFLVCVSAPATYTLLHTIGKYDPFTYAGASLLGLFTVGPTGVLGVLIMALGNPEMALVTSFCLAILSRCREFGYLKRTAYQCASVTILYFLTIKVWHVTNGLVADRALMLPVFLLRSISNWITDPLNYFWSLGGVAWLLYICFGLRFRGRNRLMFCLSGIAVPLLMTLITTDGPRVFSLLSLPVLLIASKKIIDNFIYLFIHKRFPPD